MRSVFGPRTPVMGAEKRKPIKKEVQPKSCTPFRRRLGAMQHTSDEANALTQSNETNHHGQHHRQKADDFVHDTTEHFSVDNLGQSGSCSSRLQNTSFLKKNIKKKKGLLMPYGCGRWS